jgi:D-sedoheptulose 7-phosphate isomerase
LLILEDTQAYIQSYFSDLVKLLNEVRADDVLALADALHAAWAGGKNVVLMGNGGSSATVSHIVADLQKNVFLHTGRPVRAICLTDSAPLVTAWANDTRFDNVFAGQVACWVGPGDVVIAVSGSGESPNVINGIEAANRLGATTIGLAGHDGGTLRRIAGRCLVVASDNMQRIEDVHLSILHAAFLALLERIIKA